MGQVAASFTRLKQIDEWGVRVPRDVEQPTAGDAVSVVKRDGGTSTVVVVEQFRVFDDAILYRVSKAQEHQVQSRGQGVVAEGLTPGVYEVDGTVYAVKFNRTKDRLYAKRLVESAARLNAEDDHVEVDFVYDAGAIYKIEPEHRMALDKAKALTIRYGRCINCGRRLKAAKSVEQGIGPVCIKAFA